MANSFYLVSAISTFLLGLTLYLVSISSTAWQGLRNAISISLWRTCYKMHIQNIWVCNAWHTVPDFVRSAQAFCIISLLCCAVCIVILVAAFALRCLNRSRLALIVLSLMTFTSACMISMAVTVMGVKGKDHLHELKQNDDVIYMYYLKEVVISGHYEIGWAFVLAIVAALINFISFVFFLLEYKDVTDIPPPAKV